MNKLISLNTELIYVYRNVVSKSGGGILTMILAYLEKVAEILELRAISIILNMLAA